MMQWAIGFFGLIGLLMMISKNDTIRLFQSWVNAPLQLPWLVMLYDTAQWGFFANACGYAAICCYTFVRDLTPTCQYAHAWWQVSWWAAEDMADEHDKG